MRLTLLVLSPLLFFCLMEAGLRLGGYGYPTGFFLDPDANGARATNDRFGWRFFPRSLARGPHPQVLPVKAAGSVRIVVLGESAAMGTPDPAYGFGQILGVMLREQYPGVQFEVVNGAMTAISSHVCLQIARDCAPHAPDIFVVYMGNNEVVGPYGPGTVFQHWSPNRRLIQGSLWARSTRVGQMMEDAIGYFRGSGEVQSPWRGMEMFINNTVAADDPRLAAVYDNYRKNLVDICETARRAGAPVVVSTVAVNLRDCPPFASLHRPDLAPGDLAKWESLDKEGNQLEAKGCFAEALDRYEAAVRIDDRFAELHFRAGRCLIGMGRFAEAKSRFELARDLDALRFRADNRINAIIREVAAEQEGADVHLVDAERTMAEGNPDRKGILGGDDLFYEHVHLTFDGNYVLAKSFLDQMREALPQLARLDRGPVPSMQRCAELLALTSWDECQMAADMVQMTGKAPFTNQLTHNLRQAAARRREDELRKRASTQEAKQAAWRTYEAALAQRPDDWNLCLHFGRLALHCGRPDEAVKHLQVAVAKVPWDSTAQRELGNALVACGKPGEATVHFRMALEIQPNDEVAHYNLGNLLAGRRQTEEAIACYRRALEIRPDYAAAHYNLGNTLAGRGDQDAAIAHLQKAVEIEPDALEFHNNLAAVLASCGRVDEAIPHFEKALELAPDNAGIRDNLAAARSEQKTKPDRGKKGRK